ncbi:MAG: TIGR03745 family integrating conjugative element membrane protein [Candidatus Competibacteraceae bacterium]|nr:TIGR03745 family integrating conjugative element membrane protein [Candidatus Competibacteraceae bacterium]
MSRIHTLRHLRRRLRRFHVWTLGLVSLSFTLPALSALPTVATPAGLAADSTNWLDAMKLYARDGAVVLAAGISAVGFLWLAYMAISKFNEARNGRAEWSEVGLLGGAGAATLLFSGFLLNQVAGIFA